MAIVEVCDIHTYYGDSYVLQGVSLTLHKGRIAAILGRNGMGKTTLIRSLAGLTPPRTGDIIYRGRSLRGKPLPPWAKEIHCASWAQFFLKFIISHPAVTCAIPATAKVDHLADNMAALQGPLPDAAIREQMVRYIADM